MATGRIVLPALAWHPPDGSASNLAATLDFKQSGGAAPSPRYPKWIFNNGGIYGIQIAFNLPADYASDMDLKISWFGDVLSGNCYWQARVAAMSESDAATPFTKTFAAGVAVADAVDGTQYELCQTSISLGEDSAAAGDFINILLERLGDHASDTMLDQAHFLGAILEYTTT